jgi:putative endopeptidase
MGTPVFSDADQQAFLGKCTVIANDFSTIELEPGEMYDGQHVVAEAAADLCGMQVMLDLMGKMDSPDYKSFYAKGAEFYAETVSPLVYPQFKTDGHPLHYLRVNVNAQMFEPFYETYGVTEGDGMYLAPGKRITIWGKNA